MSFLDFPGFFNLDILCCDSPSSSKSSSLCDSRSSSLVKVDHNYCATNFTCHLCSKYFTDIRKFKSHKLKVHNIKKKKLNGIVCKFCDSKKTFSSTLTYKNHIKKFHKEHVETKSETPFKCSVCYKFYKSNPTLRKHRENIHKIIDNKIVNVKNNKTEQSKKFAICAVCKEKVFTNYRDHLTSVHQEKIDVEELTFQSKKDFLKWKYDEQFCIRQLYRKRGGNLYVCSNNFKATKESYCPSRMRVQFETDGQVKLVYIKTHLGHEKSKISHRISEDDVAQVLSYVEMGLDTSTIKNNCRKSANSSLMVQNMTVRHINNIRRKKRIIKNEFDYIKTIAGLDLQWVRYFNHELDPETGELKAFSLVLMTESQVNYLKEYGKNAITIDTTDCTNRYRLNLTTILVIDDNRNGVPGAFFLSLKLNTEDMLLFFQVVKTIVGDVETDSFMSDMSDCSMFNAWTAVMPCPRHRLLYTNHLTSNWLENLAMVPEDKRIKVKSKLFSLLNELNVSQFEAKLASFLDYLQMFKLQSFYEYFLNSYVNKSDCLPQFWAYCHRIGKLNSDMTHVETFNNNLNSKLFLNHRRMVRLDDCVDILLKYVQQYDNERTELNSRTTSINPFPNQCAAVHSPLQLSSIDDDDWLDGDSCLPLIPPAANNSFSQNESQQKKLLLLQKLNKAQQSFSDIFDECKRRINENRMSVQLLDELLNFSKRFQSELKNERG